MSSEKVGSYGASLRLLWLVLCSLVPISMISFATSMWANFFLFVPNLSVHITHDQQMKMFHIPRFYWYACLGMGVFTASWCSDHKFWGSRWVATIFFQVGLIIFLLFFWLSPVNFTAILYPYLSIGMLAFAVGAIVSIFIVVIESIKLVNDKRLGVSIGAIIVFMYCTHFIVCGEVSLWIHDRLGYTESGWNAYFAIVFFTGILATLALWFCRPLPSKT